MSINSSGPKMLSFDIFDRASCAEMKLDTLVENAGEVQLEKESSILSRCKIILNAKHIATKVNHTNIHTKRNYYLDS